MEIPTGCEEIPAGSIDTSTGLHRDARRMQRDSCRLHRYTCRMYRDRITVPDHDGGRPMEVNACILITHMVYL
jgi:hypothetical protein